MSLVISIQHNTAC